MTSILAGQGSEVEVKSNSTVFAGGEDRMEAERSQLLIWWVPHILA
jgi:hypothetical protein